MILKNFLSVLIILFCFSKTSFAACEENYIPPTNYKQLIEIRDWAIVLAFIPMAKKAGYVFDAERYMLDFPNPNQAAFNFGFVTALTCYPVDVITSYYSYSFILNKLYYQDAETFKVFYIEHASKHGYTEYLKPIESIDLDV